MEKNYVDWYSWIQQSTEQTFSSPDNNLVTWKDDITGKIFSASEQRLEETREKIIKKVDSPDRIMELLRPTVQNLYVENFHHFHGFLTIINHICHL